MTQQRRPINGGNANGAPIPCLAAGTTVHTVPVVTNERVGPVIDELRLFLSNTTGAPILATVTIDGVAFFITVAANTVLQVLSDHPVLGTIAAPAVVISIAHAGADNAIVAWGSFTRA